jgi:hypothetical protein
MQIYNFFRGVVLAESAKAYVYKLGTATFRVRSPYSMVIFSSIKIKVVMWTLKLGLVD